MSEQADNTGIPMAMQWQIKRLKVLQKETISMTPNKTQDVKPGQTIIVDLPYNSKCDLGSFSWFYDGSTAHNGSPNGYDGYVQTRFFPRNSASVIQKFTVKINGGIKVDIPDYNFVYNMLHDYTQGADALKRRQTGGENSDPSNKLYITADDICERRGYSIAKFDPALTKETDNMLARDKARYCVRSWLSLFGGNASTQVVDTQMLGTVTVEIQLAPASMLMTGTAVAAGALTFANNHPSKDEVGRDRLTADIAVRGAVLAAETADYTLTNLEFRCVRYHMGPEFDVAVANALNRGYKYKLWFPNYTVQSGRPVPANNKATTERFSISMQSLDYVIGTFRLPNYDTIGQPLNTILVLLFHWKKD